MAGALEQYEIVFGRVEGAKTAFEFAKGSTRVFVRSQFQIAFDSPKATGSRMSALEAYYAFGWDKLAEIGEQGVALLSRDMKNIHRLFDKQLTETGLGFDDVASRAGWQDEEKVRFETSGRAPIRALQQFASIIGFDERSVGSAAARHPDSDVAYRMRSFGQDNVVQFSTSLKLLLIEASWIIERQYNLLEMLMECEIVKSPPFLNYRMTDNDYGDYKVAPWMRGFALAHALRKNLRLDLNAPITSMRHLVEDVFGIPVVLVSYPGKFAGATIQTHGMRGVVINVSGPKGSPLTRRSTLAHELCHIIYDGAEQLKSLHVDFDEDMADYAASANDDVERRANAFAIEFLVNRELAQESYVSSHNYQVALANLVSKHGVSSGAVRQHIANGLNCHIDMIPPLDDEVNIDQWRYAENSLTDFFPAKSEIPPQRLGNFAHYIELCVRNELITRDSASTMLRCSTKEVDDVLRNVRSLHPSGL